TGRNGWVGERRHRCEPTELTGSVAMQAGVERLPWQQIRPTGIVSAARVYIRDQAALADRRCKRQASAPVCSVRDLPAANEQIGQSAGVAQKHFSSANRQFVYGAENEYVIAVEVVRSVSDALINRVEVIGVVVRFRIGIVRQELQALREALFHL